MTTADMASASVPVHARPWFAPLIVALAALATLAWRVHPWYDPVNDASMYIACARSLARGDGYSYLGEPFTIRPPGFSALLAPFVAGHGFDPLVLNWLTSLFAVACLTLFFAWARSRTGTCVAAGLAALVWLNPLVERFANQTMSDLLGVGLVFACLLLERWASARPSLARDAVLALSIGLSAWVRTLSVLLVPAVIAGRIAQRLAAGERGDWLGFARRKLLVVAVIPCLVFLPWPLRNASLGERAASDRTMLYSYSTGMWHSDRGDPESPVLPLGQVLARIPERGAQMLSLLATNMQSLSAGPWARACGALLLALALWTAARRRETADFFLLATLALLAIYFGFRDRLFFPVWMLVLPSAAATILSIAERWLKPRVARTALAVTLFALALGLAAPRRYWPEIERTHAIYEEFARSVDAAVPQETRLAAMIGWHYEVFLDRPVYNLGFAYRRPRGTDGISGTDGIEEMLQRRAIDAIIAARADPAAAEVRPWLRSRFESTKVEGGGSVFWVKR